MKFLITYFRECFCKHQFELIGESANYDMYDPRENKLPMYHQKTYMCSKCGYVKKVKY